MGISCNLVYVLFSIRNRSSRSIGLPFIICYNIVVNVSNQLESNHVVYDCHFHWYWMDCLEEKSKSWKKSNGSVRVRYCRLDRDYGLKACGGWRE